MNRRGASIAFGMALGVAGCCGERPGVLCVMTKAMDVSVVDAIGNAAPGAFIRISGPTYDSSCPSVAGASGCEQACVGGHCTVWGHAGSYDIEAGAPGFQSKRVTVYVRDTSGRCDWCQSVASANIRIILLN